MLMLILILLVKLAQLIRDRAAENYSVSKSQPWRLLPACSAPINASVQTRGISSGPCPSPAQLPYPLCFILSYPVLSGSMRVRGISMQRKFVSRIVSVARCVASYHCVSRKEARLLLKLIWIVWKLAGCLDTLRPLGMARGVMRCGWGEMWFAVQFSLEGWEPTQEVWVWVCDLRVREDTAGCAGGWDRGICVYAAAAWAGARSNRNLTEQPIGG